LDFASELVRAGEVDGTAAGRLGAAVALAEFRTPPCPEHAPRPGLLIVPSVQVTCATLFSARSVFAADFASVFFSAFGSAFAAFFAAAVAFVSTPP
jgi:hypothetical protein